MITLITASLSSNTYSCALHWEQFAFVATWSRFDNWLTFWLRFKAHLTYDVLSTVSRNSLTLPSLKEFIWVVGALVLEECNTLITTSHESGARTPSIRKPASSDIISDSVGPVRHWCLLFAPPTYGNECSTSENTKDFPWGWFWIFQCLQQHLSLEKDLICNVELYHPHDNTVDSCLCDECMKSNEPSVCHKLLSITCLLEQACLQTKECQVYQFVPSTSISRQFENIHQIILRQFPTPPSEVVIIGRE